MSYCPMCQAEADSYERRKDALLEIMPDGSVRPVFQRDDEVWNQAVELCARVAASYEPQCESCPRGVEASIRHLKRVAE